MLRILSLSIIFVSHAYALQWNINDVSYLLPLAPEQKEINYTPQTQAKFGKLLPYSIYEKLPVIIGAPSKTDQVYQSLRVVAIRIDPCFQNASHQCLTPQIRFVWQPIYQKRDLKNWTTADAAIHTFYQLTLKQFKTVTSELWQLKEDLLELGVSSTNTALSVHPAVKHSDQTKDYFLNRLKQILLNFVGQRSLVQVTFMSLRSPERWWRFGGIEKYGRQWRTFNIPRINQPHTDLFNMSMIRSASTGIPNGMNATIAILPSSYPSRDNLHPVINQVYREGKTRSKTLYRVKLEAVNRFENPNKTNPNNLDCASCHFAEATRHYILDHFPELKGHKKDRYLNPDRLVHNTNNTSITPMSTKIVRAFGYFNDQPAISQRVINESVESADILNRSH